MNRWKDWYEQGLRDFKKAKLDLKYRYYEWVCFTSQQAAEKVLKALGLRFGYNLWGHSLTEIIKILKDKVDIPEEILKKAQLLDLYYIPATCPNGFPSGKPADYFNLSKAEEALDATESIIEFCNCLLSK